MCTFVRCIILVPKNGLVIFCGTIITEEGKEKLINMDFEAYRPINRSLYHCDNKFHTEVFIHVFFYSYFFFMIVGKSCSQDIQVLYSKLHSLHF